MLHHGAPANHVNSKGQTPMHLAAKVGANVDIAELKEKGNANINQQDNEGKTPIFYAKDYKTVVQLLKYGAKPLTKAKDTKYGQNLSALEYLMKRKRDDTCPNAILDKYMDLQKNSDLVLDFSVFKDHSCSSQKDAFDNSFLDTCSQVIDSEVSYKVMNHPLLQTFLQLKVQTVWPIFTLFTVFYHLLVIPVTISVAGVSYTLHTSCSNTTEMGKSSTSYKTMFEWIGWEQEFEQNESDRNHIKPIGDNSYICFESYIKFPNGLHIDNSNTDMMKPWKNSVMFSWTVFILLTYIIKEFIEFLVMGKQYFKFIENLYAVIFIVTSTCFLGFSNYSPYYASKFVGWLVFMVWFEVFFYIANCDIYFNIGDYAYMSVQVAKPALACLIAHLPIFLAFTFGFDIMLRNNPLYDTSQGNYFLGSFAHVLSMMTEPSYEDNFAYSQVEEHNGHLKSAQVMGLLFIIMVPIIIVNLLIAVSVSETDLKGMKQMSRLMRMKRNIKTLKNFKFLAKKDLFSTLLKPLERKVSTYSNPKHYTYLNSTHYVKLSFQFIVKHDTRKVCKYFTNKPHQQEKYGILRILKLKVSKETYDEMAAYTEEKIKNHNEILKAIDDDKDNNQNHLNKILWEAEKDGFAVTSNRPYSTLSVKPVSRQNSSH